MLYKIGKKFFIILLNVLKFIQVALVFLSFFIILYWLFQLGGATFIQPAAPFFDSIKDLVHLFYTRVVTIENESIDFSFLIATFALLFIVWCLKFVIEDVDMVEKRYDSTYKVIKQKAENLFNFTLEQQSIVEEHRNNYFMILIKFNIINLAKESFYSKDTNFDVGEKQKEILSEFAQNISQSVECSKKILSDEILLSFNGFKNVDETLLKLTNVINGIKNKHADEHLQINYLVGIDTYSESQEALEKLKKLAMLTKLGLKDKVICLATFKRRYSLIYKPKYFIESVGIYKIDRDEEVFCIKSLK